jgi:hypothetical protein
MRYLIVTALLGSIALMPSALAQSAGGRGSCEQLMALARSTLAREAGSTPERERPIVQAGDEEACGNRLIAVRSNIAIRRDSRSGDTVLPQWRKEL